MSGHSRPHKYSMSMSTTQRQPGTKAENIRRYGEDPLKTQIETNLYSI